MRGAAVFYMRDQNLKPNRQVTSNSNLRSINTLRSKIDSGGFDEEDKKALE